MSFVSQHYTTCSVYMNFFMDVDYERGTILEEADVTYFTILSEFSSYGS